MSWPVPRCDLPLEHGTCVRPEGHDGGHWTTAPAPRQPWTDTTEGEWADIPHPDTATT